MERLREAAAVVEGRLPVTARIAQARLMAGGSEADSWHTVAVLPLGGQERLSAPAPGHG